ncbi:MAG: O-antigen ligase family protein [Steroidobacteraceae bacterium]
MTAAEYAERAGLWVIVAIGFTIPISTAFDNVLVAALLVCFIASGRFGKKWAALRANPFVLLPCGLFLLHLAGAFYSMGTARDILYALDKASVVLLILVVIALNPGKKLRDRALYAFMAATLLTLVLSFALWLGIVPEGGIFKGVRPNPTVFKGHITHGVFMAYAAFVLALAAINAAKPGTKALLALLAGLSMFNVLFMVHGRTGQLVLLALALYFLMSVYGGRGVLAAAAAGLLIGAAAYLSPSSSLHQRTLTTIKEFEHWRAGKPATMANMRLEAWTNSVQLVRQHPVIGVGTGGFATAYAKQVYGTIMPPLGQPENQYLLTSVQFGVVGLAVLLALFGAQWHLAARLGSRTETQLARGLVIAMVVGCFFNSFLRDHTEALFYAWLSGLLFAGLRPAASRG